MEGLITRSKVALSVYVPKVALSCACYLGPIVRSSALRVMRGGRKQKDCAGRLWQREEGGKRRRSGRVYGLFVGGSEKKGHKKREV